MSLAIFHGDKGGVGKSSTAAMYGEYVLSRRQHALAVIECDTQNPDVARYFKGSATIHCVDLRQASGWTELFSILDEEAADDILVSLPGNIGATFAKGSADLMTALKGTRRSAAIVWTLGRTNDSIARLRDAINAYPELPIIAVRNLYLTGGDPDRFIRWINSDTRKLCLANGGRDISVPELADLYFDQTFGATPQMRFATAGQRYGDRLKVNKFLNDVYEAFDQVADMIKTGVR